MFDQFLDAIEKSKEFIQALDISVKPPTKTDQRWKFSVGGNSAVINIKDGKPCGFEINAPDIPGMVTRIDRALNEEPPENIQIEDKSTKLLTAIACWGEESITGGLGIAIVTVDPSVAYETYEGIELYDMDDTDLFRMIRTMSNMGPNVNLIDYMTSTGLEDHNIEFITSKGLDKQDFLPSDVTSTFKIPGGHVVVINVFPKELNSMDEFIHRFSIGTYAVDAMVAALEKVAFEDKMRLQMLKPELSTDRDMPRLPDLPNSEMFTRLDYYRHSNPRWDTPPFLRLAECYAKAAYLAQLSVLPSMAKVDMMLEPKQYDDLSVRKWFTVMDGDLNPEQTNILFKTLLARS